MEHYAQWPIDFGISKAKRVGMSHAWRQRLATKEYQSHAKHLLFQLCLYHAAKMAINFDLNMLICCRVLENGVET